MDVTRFRWSLVDLLMQMIKQETKVYYEVFLDPHLDCSVVSLEGVNVCETGRYVGTFNTG